jgi:uncharacterized protein YcbX
LSPSLTGLFVYPIKGARGTALDCAAVDSFGPRFDRRWMIVAADGIAVTQRDDARLALIRPQLVGEALVLTAAGMPDLPLPIDAAGPDVPVRVWADAVRAVDCGDEAALWLSDFLRAAYRLVFMADDVVRPVNPAFGRPGDRVSFADGYPFLLISQAALDELNSRLAVPVPMDRFRPNLVVGGVAAHAEDGWARAAIGAIRFDVVKPCPRCAVPTVDQDTARRSNEPLRTLATYRRIGGQVMFGQNLIHRGTGVLRRGDAVTILEIR